MSIQKDTSMSEYQNINENDSIITKNALEYFKLEKHNNIKKDFVKKNKIVMDPQDVLNNLCFVVENTNNIMLDYRYFKCFVQKEHWDNVFNYFYKTIETVLQNHNTFNVHVYIKSLSMMDIDKCYSFIGKISQIMKDAFPDKLGSCYIYQASFIFSQLIKIISKFVDKKTKEKIKLIEE
uniref:CRAL-TRIO domain-containing protein n=1 Tax=viral metagenome TaxID=1070528 RepID=A0A6C0KX38_9ZZZZ